MKKLLAYLLLNCLYFQAVTSQIAAPVWQFSGTPVEWAKRPNQLYYSNKSFELFLQRNAPILTNDYMYILLTNPVELGNYDEGSTLIKYDLSTGDTIWQREYSALGEVGNNGYNYFPEFYVEDTIIHLYGYLGIDTVNGSGRKIHLNGFPSRRQVSTITGSTVKHEYSVDFKNLFGYTNPNTWHKNGDDRWFYYFQLIRPPFDTIAKAYVRPYQLKSDLSSQLMDSTKAVYFDIPANNLMVFCGPLCIGKDSFIHFGSTQIKSNLSWRHFMWKVNIDGQPTELFDITKIIGGEDSTCGYYGGNAVISGNSIRMKVQSSTTNALQRDGVPGYIYLDFNGNLIKDQRNLQIDGKYLSKIVSTDLAEGVLHVVQFLNEKNVFIYLEDKFGNFKKVGSLFNEGSHIYMYIPVRVNVTPSNDALLSFMVLVDSSFSGYKPLEYGGWPYFCKISGEHIGLKTGVFDEKVAKRLRVYPNPGRGDFYLEDSIIGELTLLDIQGRQVMNKECLGECKIEINYLPDGLYLLKVMDQKNQEVKVCKIFKQSD